MEHRFASRNARRGITVLGLVLLIIAVILIAVFLVRYLRTRPAVSLLPTEVAEVKLSQESFDQLDLAGVIQVVRRDAVNLLGVGPNPARRAKA